MKRAFFVAIATLLGIATTATFRGVGAIPVTSLPRGPVVDWSLEAQRAIVPPPGGNGNKFPGEAAVYMAIVHVAMYDAAVAIQRGYRPYAISLPAPAETSPATAIAAAAHGVLVALLPTQRGDLDHRYAEYVSTLRDDTAKANGIAVGDASPPGSLRCARTTVGARSPNTFNNRRRVPASLSLIQRDRSSDFGCQESDRSRSTAPGSFALTAQLR